MYTSVFLYLVYLCTRTYWRSGFTAYTSNSDVHLCWSVLTVFMHLYQLSVKDSAYTSSYCVYLCSSAVTVLKPTDGQWLRVHFQLLRIPLFNCTHCTHTGWQWLRIHFKLLRIHLFICSYCTHTNWRWVITRTLTAPMHTSVDTVIFLEKRREGHRQSDEHWNRFKGNVEKISERLGGAHMGFSGRIYTFLNWTELNCTCCTHAPVPTDGQELQKVMWQWVLAFTESLLVHAGMVTAARCVGFMCSRWEFFSIQTWSLQPSMLDLRAPFENPFQ